MPLPSPFPTQMNTGPYLWGVESVKRFVDVRIVINLTKKQNVDVDVPPCKNVCGQPCPDRKYSAF